MKTTKIIKMLSTGLALASIILFVNPAMGMGLDWGSGDPGPEDQGPPAITPLNNYLIGSGSPGRITTDAQGKVYVTDPDNKRVLIYSNNGVLLKTIWVAGTPFGIAVDQTGLIFISDITNNNVGVYRSDGELWFKLGQGDEEFGLPNDIGVATERNRRRVFVSDSAHNMVKMFDLSISPDNRRFGGAGQSRIIGDGMLDFPTGITVDEDSKEIYVIDHNNKNVRIFDLYGNLKNTLDINDKHLRPLGITKRDSWIFITDAYHSMVSIYEHDPASNTYAYVKTVGVYGDGLGEYKTPSDIAADKDGKLFVANTNNQRVEVLGIESLNSLELVPRIINFSAFTNGSAITQSVEITSPGNETDWTATESSSWISLSSLSGVTPAAVDVTANPALAVGSYTTEVVFSTPSGTEAVLLVNLEVRDLSPTLSVAPSLLNLVYKKGSANLPSGDLAVSSSGPAVDWNASASENWLILDKASGFTPDTIHVSTADSIKDFAPGSYSADVVVNSNAADGVPRTVMVNLDVLEEGAITVTTNLDEAGFTITGTESSFSGGGKTWNAVDVIAEDYTISFTHVDGYTKPYTRTFTVEPGETAEIDALYLDAPAVTHLIAGLGYGYDKTVAVYTVEGSLAFTFSPDFVRFRDNIKIEAGDMDGDGIDEIIVTNGSDTFMVYSAVGTEIAAYQFAEAVHNLEIAVDDFDNDGKAEILAGYISDNFDTTEVKSFGLAGNLIADEGLLLSQNGGQAFTFAAGDINGDGALELVMAQKTVMTAYQVFENDTSLLWSRVLAQSIPPAVAMGDINGDGVDEICFAQREENIVVTCLNGDGTDFGFEMNAFSEYKETSGASIALGDTDGDGLDEIGVGAGANRSRESLIKLFESNGQFINVIRTLNSEYGVNVSFGSFGN